MKSLKQGVLVGSDENLEWLLPWWWDNYQKYNRYEVAFADFGMSKKARSWCEDRGEVIIVESISSELLTSNDLEWANVYGVSYNKARQGWFKKPLALAQTPFEITLWCDLDCEVLKDLKDLFSKATYDPFLAIVKELSNYESPYTIYNGGVILYHKEARIIKEFSSQAVSRAKEFWGDDRLLSALINDLKEPVIELDEVFNWRIGQGVPADAYILHWTGEWGKKYIQKLGGISPFIRH